MRVRIGAMSMALVGVAALLLVCCGVPSLRVEAAFNAPVATAPAAAAAAGGSGYAHLGARADSELLRSLTTFELVTIASPQLSLTHKRSIARDALQPHLLSSHAQAQRLPRRFSKRVSLSFQSERHTVRKTVMSVETGRLRRSNSPSSLTWSCNTSATCSIRPIRRRRRCGGTESDIRKRKSRNVRNTGTQIPQCDTQSAAVPCALFFGC
jgi:hypothetical protein